MKILIGSVLFCLLAAGSSLAQPTHPPAGNNSTNQLSVRIWPQLSHIVFHAPATVRIRAIVTLNAPSQQGDFVGVEFFAGATHLGSGKAVWRSMLTPLSRPGQAAPILTITPSFLPAQLIWTNVPAGTYALTAKATWKNGLPAVSAPVPVTVHP